VRIRDLYGPKQPERDTDDMSLDALYNHFLRQHQHRTAQSTIDAFFYLVRQGDQERIKNFLYSHSDDAAYLRQLLEERCQAN
jgi:hypothetical protein